ncbi:lipoate--protein ligase [Alkaliphilus peptidifermentans]|uniref:lipoate--protein ligase n=1 Tax=Alkaliphilus peptidifermentans DSM 18978 TaxID=1120976 RepID=A0A1G5L1T3_9FIRM|nr:lipoate--protein ligase [Alkaliphilus peptidifermentans]SCZ06524.1 lipoate-protein ligase [Alkaliphilus peptidifermentans DSM 18978]
MIRIINNSTDPHFNLALEEYALKHLDIDDSIIILWQNEPSVIIGRNQNTIEEINNKYIKDNKINVVRRLSGGGTVYHDLGNLNFTFITKRSKENARNFEMFTKPVIETLQQFGVPAEFTGRNDISIEGKKFSGNAQYTYQDKLLHHGTILFNSDLAVVQEALNVKTEKIESKGIKSVRSRVTNILPYLKESITLEEFKTILAKNMFAHYHQQAKELQLNDDDIVIIKKLMDDRYIKWDWNYGESPAFTLQKNRRYPGGNLDIRMNVKDGIIEDCKIYGDYFGQMDTKDLTDQMIKLKYEESAILTLLEEIDFSQYFTHISRDEFMDCLFY